MFDKNEYREMFTQVKASDGLTRRVMTMKQNQRKNHSSRVLIRLALVAAVIALMTLTVSASETVQSWFVHFFTDRNGGELSQEQVEYIENNAQPILDSQTHDDWTVELRTAIQDGTTAYVIFRVEGPEGMDLTQWTDDQGNTWGNFIFGNMSAKAQSTGMPDLLAWSEGVMIENWSITWLDDNDGHANTRTLLFRLNPNMSTAKIDPFGSEAVYQIHMENIIWEYEDREYRQELRNGKYAGQNSVMYTPEEIERLYCEELLAEGVWDFTLCFGDWEDDSGEYVELLTQPLDVRTNVFRSFGPEIEDFATVEDTVTLTSVRLRHLTVRFCYKSIHGIPDFELYEGEKIIRPCIVLKDGTRVELFPNGNSGNGALTLETEIPIVFEDVDYIQMPDGTIIPMSERTE